MGIARVIEAGTPETEFNPDGIAYSKWEGPELKPGDLIAYMPFTDAIIMDGFEKLNLVAYKNIMATSQ